MADTNHHRRDDYAEFSENDPFAELTRIMGHDPRVHEAAPAAAQPATVADPAADDYEIDLERELAGELDFARFEDEVPAADWRHEAPAPSEEPGYEQAGYEPAGHELSHVEPVSLDDAFEAFFRESEASPAASGEPDFHAAALPAGDALAPVAGLTEDLEDALERELFAGEADFGPQADAAQPAYRDAPADQEPVYSGPIGDEAWSAAADNAWTDDTWTDDTWAADASTSDASMADSWTAEAEFDPDLLERELAAAAVPAAFTPAPQPAEAPAFTPEPEVQPHAPFAAADEAMPVELSLEDELQRLLADDAPPAAVPAPAAPAARVERPALVSFGRANLAATQPAAAPAAAVAYRPDPAPAADEAAFAPAPAYDDAAVADHASAAAPVYEAPQDELDDIFGDDFVFDLDRRDQPPAAPEVETVEVAETVLPVKDDLDIPEVDYASPGGAAPRLYDDLDADLADAFGDLGMEQPGPETRPTMAAASAAAGSAQPSPVQSFTFDDAQWHAGQTFPAADFDYENELEQAIAMSAYDDEAAEPAPRRRRLLLAAAVAGVAAVVGAGLFAMSMFGGGSDAPAIVRADPDPMKVRPENPGGTTVPNQDNEVYQRVSGGASDAAPAQERLITTAEEPVDVAARTAPAQEPSALAPGIDDDDAGLLPAKSEDRIEPEPEAASPTAAGETAMVAPRRVRTMVVRPDGTMVPREELAPAAAGEEPVVVPPPVATEFQPAAAPEVRAAPAAAEGAAEADDGPTINMPQNVAVVPTQRVEPQAAAAPRPAAPQPAVRQPAAQAPVAAAPVSAPAAAAPAGAVSEWSMQIASQPTAEGAQSTYQDLARRYGSVLEGRGVNIVRADIEGRGTYYRVRIPASSRDEAIQLCTRYKTAGGSCFVSR